VILGRNNRKCGHKRAVKGIPVQTYFGRFQGILGLYITNKCNITCRHCSVNSGPTESTRLFIDDVLESIPTAVDKEIIKGIHVSGGEPFLYQSDLQRLASEAERLGILLGINTNAFWAKNLDKAHKVLDSMPGITQLMISTDIYHEEFIPLDRIKYASIAGLERGLIVQIAVCTSGGEKSDFVDRLSQILGEELANSIPIGINPVEASGRALSLLEAHWRKQQRSFPIGRCNQINRPTVLESGVVFACCNTCVSEQCGRSPLNLGNIKASSLEEIHLRTDTDYIIQAIRTLGPKFLAEILIVEGFEAELNGIYNEGDICSLCSDIMSNPKLVEVLIKVFQSDKVRRQVAIARAAEFDELKMLFENSAHSKIIFE
jgi:organic radical activating enzyme